MLPLAPRWGHEGEAPHSELPANAALEPVCTHGQKPDSFVGSGQTVFATQPSSGIRPPAQAVRHSTSSEPSNRHSPYSLRTFIMAESPRCRSREAE